MAHLALSVYRKQKSPSYKYKTKQNIYIKISKTNPEISEIFQRGLQKIDGF